VKINESKNLIKALSQNRENKITSIFFNGGHQISMETIEKLGEFLKKIK